MARLTDAQYAERRNYLGASDFAVVAGVSRWQTPFELYLEKIGELDRQAAASDRDLAQWERGHRLEDVALDWYADIAGIKIERVRRDVRHPRLPFVVVHPDARVRPWSETRTLLEAKTARRMPDKVPPDWEVQVQMQMSATGARRATIVVLTFDGEPKPFEVVRDDDLIAALEDLGGAFWQRVIDRDPPPLDGSRSASRYLDRLFVEGPEQRADDAQAQALARLLDIRTAIKALEAEDGVIVNALKFSMAGGARLYAPQVGRVLWTAPTTRRTVKWKEVAAAYRVLIESYDDVIRDAAVELEAIEIKHTTVDEDVRTFRVTPAEESEA